MNLQLGRAALIPPYYVHFGLPTIMPTNRITSTSTLVETLQAMARERPAGVRQGSGTRSSIGVTARHDVAMLRQRLRNILVDTDTGNAESVANARNTAVCEILLWEFGSEFRNDSQFSPMADAIGKAFDTNPALSKQFTDLIEGLRKG